jgi:8-oxo-dGTP pyrophosphatase MutT (NUDIX family)
MEIFDLYDKEFNMLDKKMERGGTNDSGEYHLVVHIWIKNSDGKYLIQQRNKDSDLIPNQWACTGGAVTTGEDSITGAMRETYEEIGIQFKKEEFVKVGRFYSDLRSANYITDLYVIKKDVLIKDCVLDINEVKQVAYYTLSEYKELVKNKKAWEYERLVSRHGYYEALEKS